MPKAIEGLIAATKIPKLTDIASRPYLTVSLGGKRITALLTTGAGISCLGRHEIDYWARSLKSIDSEPMHVLNAPDQQSGQSGKIISVI